MLHALIAAFMESYNNHRRHGSLGRKAPMIIWNEYYNSISSDKPKTAQVLDEMSRVADRADTGLALDSSGDTANFANRMMNENNNKEVLNSFNNSVQRIKG
jgi:hypothetical protein